MMKFKMRLQSYILFILFSLLAIGSCDFGNTNVDPTRESDASLSEILPVAIVQTVRNIASIGGRVTGTVVQHWTGIDAQPAGYTTYLIDEQTLSVFWETGLYGGAMKDCQIMIEKAQEEGLPYYEGIARVLMAFNLGMATSYWGHVPYSQALRGTESLKSPYDLQEEVYGSIQGLLDDAIAAFSQPPAIGGPGIDDLIFRGDATRWLAATHALKARYYMHLTRRDPNAAAAALAEIDQAFQSQGGQPAFFFGSNDNESNPIALFGKERPQQMVVGDFLVNLMNSKNDPRRSKYWINVGGEAVYYQLGNPNLVRAMRNSPLSLITYTELLFLEAEALLRLDDPGAANAYTQALIHSMEDLGITSDLYNPYLAFNAGFSGLSTFEEKLERVIQQKYIALYGQNPTEAWVDFRRTGYPALEIPDNATSSFNPSLVIPRRFLYPIGERTSNRENYDAAITSQGGHLMDVPIWAFRD
jgi:hypothetical protein